MSEHYYATPDGIVDAIVSGYTVPVDQLTARIRSLDGTLLVAPTNAGFDELDEHLARWQHQLDAAPGGDYLVIFNDGTNDTDPDRLTINATGQPSAIVAGNDAIATLAELRRLEPLDDEQTYPDTDILATRDDAIQALEDACNVAFVRRQTTHAYADTIGYTQLALPRRRDITIDQVLIGQPDQATPLDPASIAAMTITGGLLGRPGGFGQRGVITYTHGYTNPPGMVRRAVRALTREWLQQERDTSVPVRATSMDQGDISYRLVTAGERGQVFDVPIANAVVQRYRE